MTMVPREADDVREEPVTGLPPRWTRLRYVRCEACGAKALVAASQCPQCEEPLGLRDSHGEPVPLAHCQNCDIYYPKKKGKCIWCGTAPATFPMRAVAWGTFATMAFSGLVWGAWWAKNTTLAPPALMESPKRDTGAVVVIPPHIEEKSSTGTVAVSLDSSRMTPESAVATAADSVTVTTSAGSTASDSTEPTDSTPAPTPVETPAAAPPPSVTPPRIAEEAPSVTPPRIAAAPVVAPPRTVKPPVKPPARAAVRAPSRPAPKVAAGTARTPAPARAAKTRWVSATVRGWVRVRSAATSSSRTIAMVGPDTRLQIGETRGGWVRVRSAGATGWAEQKQLLKNTTIRRVATTTRTGSAR